MRLGGAYVSFKCLKTDYRASLELAADILRNPTFPEAEWNRVRGQAIAALKAERDHAESRAQRALLAAIYPEEHPYRFPLAGTEASVAQLDRSALADFHARSLISARPTVIVAGDVDPDALAEELERRLTPWRGSMAQVSDPPEVERSGRARLLLLDRPGRRPGGRAGRIRRACAFEPGFRPRPRRQPDSRRPVHVAAERKPARRARLDLRSAQLVRLSQEAGPVHASPRRSRPKRLARRSPRSGSSSQAIAGDRPPTAQELDDARRSLIEGHPRQFDTPGALVNRFAGLVIHDLPVDHDAGSPSAWPRSISTRFLQQRRRHIVADALVAVVVADASRVLEQLKSLDWAPVEVEGA